MTTPIHHGPPSGAGLWRCTNEQHHAVPDAIGSSTLKACRQSIRHGLASLQGNDKRTTALAVGDAIHAAVLEPDRFLAEYAKDLDPADYPGALDSVGDLQQWCRDNGVKGFSGKRKDELEALILQHDPGAPLLAAARRQHYAQHAGRTLLSPADWTTVQECAESVFGHPTAQELLSGEGRHIELSGFARDEDTGLLLRARWDSLSPGRHICDLKSTRDASPGGFAREVGTWGYHLQDWQYREVWALLTGERLPMYFVAVQTDAPYLCAVHQIGAETRAATDRIARNRLRELALAMDDPTHWTGYPLDPITCEVRAWNL